MSSKTVGGATGLSVLLSGLASAVGLCCVATWAVPLLGVSGAILLARLGPYRPYFIGTAAVLMVVAIASAYRSRKACGVDPVLRRRRLWFILFLMAGLLVLALATFIAPLASLLRSGPT